MCRFSVRYVLYWVHLILFSRRSHHFFIKCLQKLFYHRLSFLIINFDLFGIYFFTMLLEIRQFFLQVQLQIRQLLMFLRFQFWYYLSFSSLIITLKGLFLLTFLILFCLPFLHIYATNHLFKNANIFYFLSYILFHVHYLPNIIASPLTIINAWT